MGANYNHASPEPLTAAPATMDSLVLKLYVLPETGSNLRPRDYVSGPDPRIPWSKRHNYKISMGIGGPVGA